MFCVLFPAICIPFYFDGPVSTSFGCYLYPFSLPTSGVINHKLLRLLASPVIKGFYSETVLSILDIVHCSAPECYPVLRSSGARHSSPRPANTLFSAVTMSGAGEPSSPLSKSIQRPLVRLRMPLLSNLSPRSRLQ